MTDDQFNDLLACIKQLAASQERIADLIECMAAEEDDEEREESTKRDPNQPL